MILAGLLSASLASCVVDGNGADSGTVPNGTEPPIYTITTGADNNTQTTAPSISSNPADVTYAPANDTVYVATKSAAMKLASDTTKSVTVSQLTELHRIGAATNWCKVEYNGEQYYVATKMLTTDDLGEKTFTACDKTLYASGSVNIRKYASSDNDFSEILKTVSGGTEVKVVAQSPKGWSKVECVVGGVTIRGFMSTQHLSTNPSGEADDYLQYFTALDSAVTMYVTTDMANLRAKPYNAGKDDDRGTIIATPTKGTAVTVIAKGIVEGKSWCMVQWTENSVNKTYFIASDCLSLTLSGTSATLEQMLTLYPELEKFDAAQTLYISDNVNGRSAPTLVKNEDGTNNIVKIHAKKDAVTAVAWGVIEGQDINGAAIEMTWCLIDGGATLGYYFVSYSYLTPNADGTPATPIISLDALVKAYNFTKTSAAVSMKTNKNASVYATPAENAEEVKKVTSGTTVSVVAQGTTTNGFVTNSWYIIELDGTYYFASQSDFTIA